MLALLCFCVATEFSVNKDLYSQVSCYSLLNKDEYIIYYAYTSVRSVILLIDLVDAFVYIYVFMLVCFFLFRNRFSVKKIYTNRGQMCVWRVNARRSRRFDTASRTDTRALEI